MFYFPILTGRFNLAGRSRSPRRPEIETLEDRLVPAIPNSQTILLANCIPSVPSWNPSSVTGILGFDPNNNWNPSTVAVDGLISGRSFYAPINLCEDPTNTSVLYVVDQGISGSVPAAVLKVVLSSTSNPTVSTLSSGGYLVEPTAILYIGTHLWIIDGGSSSGQLHQGKLIEMDTSGNQIQQFDESSLACPVSITQVPGDSSDIYLADEGGNLTVDTGSITGASNTNPIVINSPDLVPATGGEVMISGVQGNMAANGTWRVTQIDNNDFSLDGVAGNGTYTGGGTFSFKPRGPGAIYKVQLSDGTRTLISGGPNHVGGTYLDALLDGNGSWTYGDISDLVADPNCNAIYVTNVGFDGYGGSVVSVDTTAGAGGVQNPVATDEETRYYPTSSKLGYGNNSDIFDPYMGPNHGGGFGMLITAGFVWKDGGRNLIPGHIDTVDQTNIQSPVNDGNVNQPRSGGSIGTAEGMIVYTTPPGPSLGGGANPHTGPVESPDQTFNTGFGPAMESMRSASPLAPTLTLLPEVPSIQSPTNTGDRVDLLPSMPNSREKLALNLLDSYFSEFGGNSQLAEEALI